MSAAFISCFLKARRQTHNRLSKNTPSTENISVVVNIGWECFSHCRKNLSMKSSTYSIPEITLWPHLLSCKRMDRMIAVLTLASGNGSHSRRVEKGRYGRFSRCKCDGSHSLRRRRCTWGTSSDGCRSASSRTRSRRRGSILSGRHPSPGSCSRGTSDEPCTH